MLHFFSFYFLSFPSICFIKFACIMDFAVWFRLHVLSVLICKTFDACISTEIVWYARGREKKNNSRFKANAKDVSYVLVKGNAAYVICLSLSNSRSVVYREKMCKSQELYEIRVDSTKSIKEKQQQYQFRNRIDCMLPS